MQGEVIEKAKDEGQEEEKAKDDDLETYAPIEEEENKIECLNSR